MFEHMEREAVVAEPFQMQQCRIIVANCGAGGLQAVWSRTRRGLGSSEFREDDLSRRRKCGYQSTATED